MTETEQKYLKRPVIYLASRISRKDELKEYADKLTENGFEVCATWVYGNEDGLTREDIAALDFTDVMKADVCIVFTDPVDSLNRGGARHSELAFAYINGARIILVGDREQVFHHLPISDMYVNYDKRWNFDKETAKDYQILERVDTFDEAFNLLNDFWVLDFEAEWFVNANRK